MNVCVPRAGAQARIRSDSARSFGLWRRAVVKMKRSFLLELRKARRIHEVAVDMVRQWSLSLRIGLYLFPFRIGLELSPILPGFLAARVLQDVHKEVLRIWRVFRTPKANALHVVSPENSVGMIAKPSD